MKKSLIGTCALIAMLMAIFCITPTPALAVNEPPIAHIAGDDPLIIEGNTIGGADVQLDGSLSSDPDGDAITFWWSGPVGVTFDDPTSSTPIAFCPLGSSTVQLVVTDTAGNTDIAATMIDVVDTTPPEVTVSHLSNRGGKALPFYVASATDIVDGPRQLYIEDTGSGTLFGPFSSGVTFQYIVAPGATPDLKPSHIPNIDCVIMAQGPGQASATDACGNTEAVVFE